MVSWMYLELARRNLKRQRMRTLLAIIGIIIGVMTISSVGIFGNSLKMSTIELFQDVANEIVIYPSFPDGYNSIDHQTLRIIDKMADIKIAIPVKSESGLITLGKKKAYVTIYGLEEDGVKELFDLKSGSVSLAGNNVVVGSILAEKFNLRVGSKIGLENHSFRVAGILEEKGRSFDINPDRGIIISERTFDTLYSGEYEMVIVKTVSIDNVEEVSKTIKDVINKRETKIRVWEMKNILESINRAFTYISRFLMAIAGISLLVAGVSILNIMLMSAIERTKEIGVMKAIGASRKEIMLIFLLETLILGAIGSSIGGFLSILGGYGIDLIILKSTKYIFIPKTALYVMEGVVFGLGVSIISGLYPAWKASNLEPIEALRYE
jgi:putative ABC transport system permease protein